MAMDSPTQLLYLTYDGNFQHSCEAVVVHCTFMDPPMDMNKKDDALSKEGKHSEENITTPNQRWAEIILDRTIFHPQGGGQPYDKGIILYENKKAFIDRIICSRETNIVKHVGFVNLEADDFDSIVSTDSFFPSGSHVLAQVDVDRRNILSECHTAGHVVDAAMARCHEILPPLKGYHFLDGPYVEYSGNIAVEEREILLPRLQDAFQVRFECISCQVSFHNLMLTPPFLHLLSVFTSIYIHVKDVIDENIGTKIESLTKAQADIVCNRIQQNFDFSSYGTDEIRIVTVGGWPCPCGGTHVRSTGMLKGRGWKILDLKCKKGIVRVRYGTNHVNGQS